ncbi:MAG: hypothetical protein FJ109_02935 [Deltaproteobacteria bacterium]|nr:hypothetical protein [Deltaproteobacteria bacterium]
MRGVEIIKSLNQELEIILKDVPIEHIVKGVQVLSRPMYIRYFKGYRLQVAGKRRIREMIDKEIRGKGNEELAQLITTLWNRSNNRLYHAMYNKVRTINEEVDKIVRIEDDAARVFLEELLEEYDADRLYLCILLNEVKFSREVIKEKLDKDIPFEVWPPEPPPEEEEEGGKTPESEPGETKGTPEA